MGRGSGLLFNRARNSTVKSRFFLVSRKRHLTGPGVADLLVTRGCAHADDPQGLCACCQALADARNHTDDDNHEE